MYGNIEGLEMWRCGIYKGYGWAGFDLGSPVGLDFGTLKDCLGIGRSNG